MENKWRQNMNRFRKDTRRDILETTMQLILERGVADVTVVDITKMVGISRVTFYKHYNSIHEIAFDIQLRILSEMIDAIDMQVSEGESGAEKLKNCLNASINIFKTHQEQLRFIAIFDHSYRLAFPTLELQEIYSEFILQFRKQFLDIILLGIKDNSLLENSNPELLALTITHSLLGLMQRLATKHNHFSTNSFDEDIMILENFTSLLIKSLVC
ncbi:TetR/AcrR family transcriptional regulator [Bacillus wiedmannii]|uniref:TetR/AcrR family transcriptional regulator n=1 Tax=Bacillus wiedmannii TaxID=1890302 RepID=UPI003CF2A5DE